MCMTNTRFLSLKSVVQFTLCLRLTWLYVFSAFLSLGSSYCLSWESSLLLSGNNIAGLFHQSGLEVEFLKSGGPLLSDLPHAQDNSACRVSVLPNDTEDLIEKNNQLTGCILVLSGVYIVNYPIYIKNKLVGSEAGGPAFWGRESVKTYVQPALETGGPGVITELVFEPAGADSFHKTAELALKAEAQLLMLGEGSIQGVAVLPPDSLQNVDCSFLNTIYYLKPQGTGSDVIFWPHILSGESDLYCLQEYSKEVGGDKRKLKKGISMERQKQKTDRSAASKNRDQVCYQGVLCLINV